MNASEAKQHGIGPTLTIADIAHHRNGVCGEPFFVVLFTETDDEDTTRRFVATCFFDFDEETERYVNPFNPRIALLDRDLLIDADIVFGSNSWRGDRYATFLLNACQNWSDVR